MSLAYLENIGKAKDMFRVTPNSPFESLMKDFAELQTALAVEELQKGNPPHYATGSLAQSITFRISLGDEIGIEFLMNDYWDYINEGVNGVQNNFGAPYSFKTLNPSPLMIDAFQGVGSLDGFIRAKNIHQLVYVNEFNETIVEDLVTDDDFRRAAFVFARATKRDGIEGNNFINNVFNEEALDKFEQEILKAIAGIL